MTAIIAIISIHCTQLKTIRQRFHSLFHILWVLSFIFRQINTFGDDSVPCPTWYTVLLFFTGISVILSIFHTDNDMFIREVKLSIRHFDGLVQDYSNSSALAMELLQSCTKPSIWCIVLLFPYYAPCYSSSDESALSGNDSILYSTLQGLVSSQSGTMLRLSGSDVSNVFSTPHE